MDLAFDEALRLLNVAGLSDEMLSFVEMEPLPAGDGIAELVRVPDPGVEHVGGDSSGGAWLRLSDGAIILASSEGEAARVGPDLRTVLAVGVQLGGLYDALVFVRGSDWQRDRAAWVAARKGWGLPPGPADPDAAREIAALLSLPALRDPFATLHGAVRAVPDGFVFDPMDGPWPGFAKPL